MNSMINSSYKGVYYGNGSDFSAKFPELSPYISLIPNREKSSLAERNVFKRQPSFKDYFSVIDTLRDHVLYLYESRSYSDIIKINSKDVCSSRLIIILAAESESKFFIDCSEVALDEGVVVEVHMLRGASAEFVQLNNGVKKSNIFVFADVASGAAFTSFNVSMASHNCKNYIKASLNEPTAKAFLYGVSVLNSDDSVESNTIMSHVAERCESFQHYKAVVGGKASSAFAGMVYVAKDSQQTSASQQSNNILLSDSANVRNRPQLEIYADDVKCSHGSTTGKLDEEAIFYMRQRGIGREQAQRLQITGFVSDILNKIRMENLKEEIIDKIEKHI